MLNNFTSYLSAYKEIIVISNAAAALGYVNQSFSLYAAPIRDRLMANTAVNGDVVIALLAADKLAATYKISDMDALALIIGYSNMDGFNAQTVSMLIKRARCYVDVIQCDLDYEITVACLNSTMDNSTNTVFECINYKPAARARFNFTRTLLAKIVK